MDKFPKTLFLVSHLDRIIENTEFTMFCYPDGLSFKVLLEEPGKLYLSDVRKALGHIQSRCEYKDMPDNKNYLSPKAAQSKPVIQVRFFTDCPGALELFLCC